MYVCIYIYIYIHIHHISCISYIYIYIYIYILQASLPCSPHVVPRSPQSYQTDELIILAIFYPPLKYLGGCFWLFYRLRRETPISQNWLKG